MKNNDTKEIFTPNRMSRDYNRTKKSNNIPTIVFDQNQTIDWMDITQYAYLVYGIVINM